MSGSDRHNDAPNHDTRLPPRQVLTAKFPVMSMDATPALSTADWTLTLRHGGRPLKR